MQTEIQQEIEPRINQRPEEVVFPRDNTVLIWTDGCCLKNPGGAGGWGAVMIYGKAIKWFNGHIPETTSNRAELIAMIEALRKLKRPCDVTIYSDSQITVRCATGEYGRNANDDLWEQLEIAKGLHSVRFEWVKGHNGDVHNTRAHDLATRGAAGLLERNNG